MSARRRPAAAPLLEARALSIGYRAARARRPGPGRARAGNGAPRDRVVAAGIGLSLAPGDFVCLLGPNGAGKSTLLRTLAGVQPPLAGDCELGGRPVARLGLAERAELVALVLTEQPSGGWFTVFEIAAFGRYPYTDARGRLAESDREAVRASLESVGMAAFAARPFAELSDGEKRKVLVARALAQDTPLVILDEPTVFLDAPSRLELFYLCRRLARESGKAVVLSTHDVELALSRADRLWLLGPGGDFSQGLPEELALSGALGRALSTAAVVFDAESGGFRQAEAAAPPLLEVALLLDGAEAADAEAHALLLWGRRLALRLGFRPVAPGFGAPRRLLLGGPAGAPDWSLGPAAAAAAEAAGAEAAGAASTDALRETATSGRGVPALAAALASLREGAIAGAPAAPGGGSAAC
ncbi:MAG: ABC transporter ATP-binding protein [Spirochaetaceae bacterium]|nr:ABC transporter ATP-binding protein [Spirochaetaceae bacterium]